MSAFGIDLDPVLPALARADGSDARPADAPPLADFPPAFVRPQVRGTPVALDHRWPARSEGSGLEPDVDPQTERIPLAVAWQALARGEDARGDKARGKEARGDEARLDFGAADRFGRGPSVGEALGFAAGRLAAEAEGGPDGLRAALCVPDTIDEQAQDGLLRGLRRELRRQGRAVADVALLWRPVAATLAWLATHGAKVPWQGKPLLESVGCVLHLHLGLEGMEATWVELVPYEDEHTPRTLLPGRRRPETKNALHAQPLAALAETVTQAVQQVATDAAIRDRLAWHAAWMTPLLRAVARQPGAEALLAATRFVPAEQLVRELRNGGLDALDRTHAQSRWHGALAGTPSATLLGWPQKRGTATGSPCLGIAITGCMAGWRMPDGSTFADEVIQRCGAPRGALRLQSQPGTPGLLATGAAIFTERRQQGQAAYLDSLPSLEMLCMSAGEPAWINLLALDRPWAVGGREVAFRPRGAGFLLRRGQEQLTITVHREDAKTCREVSAPLQVWPVADCPLDVLVAIDPGQGNPRVTLEPRDPALMDGGNLTLDWATAKDTHNDRDKQLADTPRASPPHTPRQASAIRWQNATFHKTFDRIDLGASQGVEGLIRSFLDQRNRRLWQSVPAIEYLGKHLAQSDKTLDERGTSGAIDSEGIPPDAQGSALVAKLVGQALGLVAGPDAQLASRALRVLAATSTRSPQLQSALREQLAAIHVLLHDTSVRGAVLAACGSCLREPADIAAFADAFTRAIKHHPNATAKWQLAEAMARITMYRQDALANIETATVEGWLEWLVRALPDNPIVDRVDRVPHITARAAEAIAYVLRRRRYDHHCLPVGSPLHGMAKARITTLLKNAPKEPSSSNNLSPSVKRAILALRSLEKYLDGHGTGIIYIPTDGAGPNASSDGGDGGSAAGSDGSDESDGSNGSDDTDGTDGADSPSAAPATTSDGATIAPASATPPPAATTPAPRRARARVVTPPPEAPAPAAPPPVAFRGADPDHHAVINAPADARLLVAAPPGAGKTKVAIDRVRALVARGLDAPQVLMISFTRAAVAEFRERLVRNAATDGSLRGVEVTTLDSLAWRLLHGLDGASTTAQLFGDHGANIATVVQRLRTPDDAGAPLRAWLRGFKHVLVDEAQDLVGARAELVQGLLAALAPDAGATVFADEAQAIYNWTNDGDGNGPAAAQANVFAQLQQLTPPLARHEFRTIHRTANAKLATLFLSARTPILDANRVPRDIYDEVTELIRGHADADVGTFDRLRPDLKATAPLVLFRTRAQVHMASSLLQTDGVPHRVRMSGLPPIVEPWIGLLLQDVVDARLRRSEFERRWAAHAASPCLAVRDRTAASAWAALRKVAASGQDAVDLAALRLTLARPRPPEDLTLPEHGFSGPVLGTIHASKGREADHVVLMLPNGPPAKATLDQVRDEARVLYVGATRAVAHLGVGSSFRVPAGSLDSGRTWRRCSDFCQLELGCAGDVDPISAAAAILAGNDEATTAKAQAWLAAGAAAARPIEALRLGAGPFSYQLRAGDLGIGGLSAAVAMDIATLRRELRQSSTKLPGMFKHVWCVGATTVAIAPDDPRIDELHGPWRESGFFLAPVIRALTMV